MALSTALRNAARTLINTFGNTGSLYTYSTATKVENTEGDITISSWGTVNSVKLVNDQNRKEGLITTSQGRESIGDDEIIIRDDETTAVNDRLTVDSTEYRVTEIRPIRTQDVVVAQILKIEKVTSTTAWS